MPVLLAVVYGRQPGGFIIKPIQLKNSRRKGKETFFAQRLQFPKLGPEALPGTVAIPGGFPEHGIECLRRGALLLSVSQVNAPIAAAHLFHQVLTGAGRFQFLQQQGVSLCVIRRKMPAAEFTLIEQLDIIGQARFGIACVKIQKEWTRFVHSINFAFCSTARMMGIRISWSTMPGTALVKPPTKNSAMLNCVPKAIIIQRVMPQTTRPNSMAAIRER